MKTDSTKNRVAEFGWPSGDRPGALVFDHMVPSHVSEPVFDFLGEKLELDKSFQLRSLHPVQGPVGRYSLSSKDRHWFVRITRNWKEPELEQAVTRHLNQGDVPANHLELAGLPFQFAGETFRVDVRQFIPGHHFTGTKAELLNLAQTLANCHRVMKTFPHAQKIRVKASNRYTKLQTIRNEMKDALDRSDFEFFSNDVMWGEKNRSWLEKLTDQFNARMDLSDHAQCLHGQIHQGNVLYLNDQAILLDLEESVHTFSSPAWDLAYFFQRFCLYDSPSPEECRKRWDTLCQGYGSSLSFAEIKEMMRQTSFFSMCVLVDQWNNSGVTAPRSEYDKFLKLERQAGSLSI